MSNLPPAAEARILNTRLFNQSTHHYKLVVSKTDFALTSNEESQEFNEWFVTPDDTLFEGKIVRQVFCLGNQHAPATVRDLIKILRSGRAIDEQTLKEYSMFTIGDHVLLTADEVIVAVNGDITRHDRNGETFTLEIGKA
uniref:Uncharacterized protein n=1 Tax=Pseudomonas phage RVTF4 TaxID=3236931 RepID=A0AB39CC99_9VIRU